MNNFFYKVLNKYIVALLIFIGTCFSLQSQSWVSEVSQDGFILKKVVSDTTVPSGQNFSYTIYYTIPAGATNVTITDNIPTSLQFLGYSVNNACGTPTVSAPAVNSMGGLLSVSWASVAGGCSGSITVTVAFPNGITCPGASARNNACIMATLNGKSLEFCTGYVVTQATASNPWNINKYPLNLAYIGGNCQYATGNDTVTFRIYVYKSVGTTGQLNLVNGVVTDTLPTGAVLVGSSCGATQTGNVITWNVGNMSALPSYNSTFCDFQIYYPLAQFPNGSNITNKATLTGDLGPTTNPCSNFTKDASTCVTKSSYQSGNISKWVYTNRQPGCAGRYLIYICNNGTVNLPVVAVDTIPSALTSISVGPTSNLTATLNGNIVNITGNLAPGQCGYVYVNFTIPTTATVGSTISNCAYFTSLQPIETACSSFIVENPSSKVCLWKEICQAQTSYTPGSIFRYRLRVQNIGGLAMNGVTLTDTLNPNLEYVGNPSYYISNTWNITSCKPNPTPAEQWSGVSLSYNPLNNVVSASLPTIASVCQNIYYTNCGMYGTGGVPYYYIEFDVKVRDTSALGNIPNDFHLSGGSLGNTNEESNTVMVLVTGVIGYNLQKEVQGANDPNYTNTTTAAAGSQVNFKLKMNSSGTAALSHVTFADLLPRDAGTSDQFILTPCLPRNSQFDLSFVNMIGTPIPATLTSYNNNTTLLANINNLLPVGAPGNSFTIGCGTNGTWASGLSAGNKNMGLYFGSTAIGTSAEYQFKALISNSAKVGEMACNSFAASGWTKHLIQSSILNYQRAGELESPKTCVTIKKDDEPTGCLEDVKYEVVCKGEDPNTGVVYYSFSLSASSCTPAILMLSSPDVSFLTTSYTLNSSPWSINATFSPTSNNNPITIHYILSCNGKRCIDSIKVDLPPCGGDTGGGEPDPKDCCREFTKRELKSKLTWNSSTGYVGLNTVLAVGPSPIKEFSATIVAARLKRTCFFSSGSWSRIFGDITGGNVTVAPGSGPQLIVPFSREAIWGPDSCVDWQDGANIKLNMLFPPLGGSFFCKDSLVFSVRYTFTDCKCITCDTTVTYTVVRRHKLLPWEGGDVGISLGMPHRPNNGNGTSIKMSDFNNGKFAVISPKDTSNDVTIQGLEFTSKEVQLVDVFDGGNKGIVQGNTAYIGTTINPGENKDIDLQFNNKSKLHKFIVTVRYLYSMEDFEEPIFSDPVDYIAYVQGDGGDIVGVETDNQPTKVRTYSIYLHNQNEYKQDISSVALKTPDGQKIIAVGPPLDEKDGVRLFPLRQEDGSYIITLSGEGDPVPYDEKVVPIFLTISGVNDKDPVIGFITYDNNNNVISDGEVQLSNSITKIPDGGVVPDNSIMVYPNPAKDIITISINTNKNMFDSRIVIRDVRGAIVHKIVSNSTLNMGTNIYNINTNKLPNGTYFIELSTGNDTISEKFIIQR